MAGRMIRVAGPGLAGLAQQLVVLVQFQAAAGLAGGAPAAQRAAAAGGPEIGYPGGGNAAGDAAGQVAVPAW